MLQKLTCFLGLLSFTGYLGMYIAYVFTVILSSYIYNRQKHQLIGSPQSSDREQGEEIDIIIDGYCRLLLLLLTKASKEQHFFI